MSDVKHIAIIGAGMCGLAAAWHFLQTGKCKVSLFDGAGVGGGASKVAMGLMHPYTGEQARRSLQATEGMRSTLRLVDEAEKALGMAVADRGGILRLALIPGQAEAFAMGAEHYGDIEHLERNLYCLRSGVTVKVPLYLQGLWLACKNMGAVLYPVNVEKLQMLSDYDRVVIAAGFGVRQFAECGDLGLKMIKGQILRCKKPLGFPEWKGSLVGKGYYTQDEDPSFFYAGASYEKYFVSDAACLESALKHLQPKFNLTFPHLGPLEGVDVQSGVRVCNKHHYFPIVKNIDSTFWVMTGMGSRGLLYHALMAERLVSEVFNGHANLELSNNAVIA